MSDAIRLRKQRPYPTSGVPSELLAYVAGGALSGLLAGLSPRALAVGEATRPLRDRRNRNRHRMVTWRLVLQLSNGENFDVDNPYLLGQSVEDVGSGVLAFVLTALPPGLVAERDELARRVVGAAAAFVATVFDRFV